MTLAKFGPFASDNQTIDDGSPPSVAIPYADLDAALSNIASNATGGKATLVIDRVLPVSQATTPLTVTVPREVTLLFTNGGVLELGDGHDLVINGPIQAPDVQIFEDGNSTPAITINPETNPQVSVMWFGAVADATTEPISRKLISGTDNRTPFKRAAATGRGNTVWIPAGKYVLGDLDLTGDPEPSPEGEQMDFTNVNVKGAGAQETALFSLASDSDEATDMAAMVWFNEFKSAPETNVTRLSGFSLFCDQTDRTNYLHGIRIPQGFNAQVEDIQIYNANRYGMSLAGDVETGEGARSVTFSNFDRIVIRNDITIYHEDPPSTHPDNILSSMGDTGLYVNPPKDGGQSTKELRGVANSNVFTNVSITGGYKHLCRISGNLNVFIAGEATAREVTDYNDEPTPVLEDMNPTAAYQIEGTQNLVQTPYCERIGPGSDYIVAFKDVGLDYRSPNGNRVIGIFGAISPDDNWFARILDDGVNNVVDAQPSGANFKFASSDVTTNNLVPNSHFQALQSSGVPEGWFVDSGVWSPDPSSPSIDSGFYRVTDKLRGAPYALKMTAKGPKVPSIRCRIAGTGAFTGIPVERLAGLNITVGVWAWYDKNGVDPDNFLFGNISLGMKDATFPFSNNPWSTGGNNRHSGSGRWEFLTAHGRVPETITGESTMPTSIEITLRCKPFGIDFSPPRTGDDITVWFSEPIVCVGHEITWPAPMPVHDTGGTMFAPLSFAAPPELETYMEMSEIAVPSTPPANKAYFYCKDVSGKTAIYAKFPDGTEVEIAKQQP